ncbi:Uncharacterized protein Fot_55374 [Forsythia ovata]|uniref:Uncharacterized protein n=1 Tax=Forsythia ovata TaxID=205694 RepID=A0ABD1P4K9_9LAMI
MAACSQWRSKHQSPSQTLIQLKIHPQELRENHRNWKGKSHHQIPHEIQFQNPQVGFLIPQLAASPTGLVPVTALTPPSPPSPSRAAPPCPTYWIPHPKSLKFTTSLKFVRPLTIFLPNTTLPPHSPPNHDGPFSMAMTSSIPSVSSALSKLFGWWSILNGKDIIIVPVGGGADEEACPILYVWTNLPF